MQEDYLFCNIKDCKNAVTKYAWVTRCSHVFCEFHGDSYFTKKSTKVKCPACFEGNMMEADIMKTNLNPHDMLLCCVRPEKTLDYIFNVIKLWSYQMQQKRKLNTEMLSEKYEKIACDAMNKLRSENSEMKKILAAIEEKLKAVNDELNRTKKKLWKYKMAYRNLASRSVPSPPAQQQYQYFPRPNSEDLGNHNTEDFLRFGRFSDARPFTP